MIYVVEAKGGGASLGVVKYNDKYVQQGTREYLERTIALMNLNPDPNAVSAALKMEAALAMSTLKYMKVQVPVARTGYSDKLKNLSFGEFNI